MASSHHAERTAKSPSIKVLNMNFDPIKRLEEINQEYQQNRGKTVFLKDVARIIGLKTYAAAQRARKLNIELSKKNDPDAGNIPALCISETDAERLIKAHYEG
jgi:hypothetical protein